MGLVRFPPPSRAQYGEGRRKKRRRKGRRSRRRRYQRGGNAVVNALTGSKATSLLNAVDKYGPTAIKSLIRLQNSMRPAKTKNQKGGFGALAGMLGAQMVSP